MKHKNVDIEMLKHPAFKKAIEKKANSIYLAFGQIVDSKFNSDIDKFLKHYNLFRQYYARAHQNGDLNEKEQKNYAILKKFMRSAFKLGPCTFAVRVEGEVKRASFDTIALVLKQTYGIQVIKHGKSPLTNEHWSNFFLPEPEKVKIIYECYKKNKQKD